MVVLHFESGTVGGVIATWRRSPCWQYNRAVPERRRSGKSIFAHHADYRGGMEKQGGLEEIVYHAQVFKTEHSVSLPVVNIRGALRNYMNAFI